jgi:hypothetical protein
MLSRYAEKVMDFGPFKVGTAWFQTGLYNVPDLCKQPLIKVWNYFLKP